MPYVLGKRKQNIPAQVNAWCQSEMKRYPSLMPNLVLGLNQTVEVRRKKCVILCIKDFLDFIAFLLKLSLLSLNDGLCICTASKKQKIQIWNRFQWDVGIPESSLTRPQRQWEQINCENTGFCALILINWFLVWKINPFHFSYTCS